MPDIKQIAKLYVENCLALTEGDRILVLTDSAVSAETELGQMRDAVTQAMEEAGYAPCVLSFPAERNMGCEIPDDALAVCLNSDVLVSFNTSLLLYAANFPEIYQNGNTNCRIALFPAGDSIKDEKDYFERMLPDTKEEILELAAETQKYGDILRDGREHELHITAANGTDLRLRIGQLSGSTHCGICAPGTIELIPAGILSNGVDEGSAEGRLVADYSTTLNRRMLKDQICFEIHDGYVVSITGGEEAKLFQEAAAAVQKANREKYNIAEFGLGFNPRAKADGQVTDGENILGGVHIGIGANSLFGGNIVIPEWHIDCMIPNASVEADGELLLKDGNYLR